MELPVPLPCVRFSAWRSSRCWRSPSAVASQVCVTNTRVSVTHCLCLCAQKVRAFPCSRQSRFFSFFSMVTRKCFLNFIDKEQRALTARTLLKDRQPPLLSAWFKSCSLMKLFRTRSWHFNTHFYLECDYSFLWKWKANNETCTLSQQLKCGACVLVCVCVSVVLYHGSMKNLWKSNPLKVKSQFAADTTLWFLFNQRAAVGFSCIILPTNGNWIAFNCYCKHTLRDCEYKWDCRASCSHGNTSGMRCTDWPWTAEFPFSCTNLAER